MPFNWPTFWTRALTALVFVAVMAIGVLSGDRIFIVLVSIIHFGCWYEYLRLIGKIHHTKLHPLTGLGFSLIGFHFILLFCNLSFLGYIIAGSFSLPVLLAGIILAIIGIFKQPAIPLKSLGAMALGLLYISFSLALFLHLRLSNFGILKEGNTLWGHGNGLYIPIIIILAIWVNDTMAYLVGSAIGKTPFSKISPKKTVEGTAGGMLLCVLAITFILKPFFHWQLLLSISLMVAIFGTIGDLIESKIKRMAGVKDSGHIMPGHGGFLDRFDSLLVAVPFVFLILFLFSTLD